MRKMLVVAIAMSLANGAPAVLAQAPTADRLTATFSDWTALCVKTEAGKTRCEVVSGQLNEAKTAQVSQIAYVLAVDETPATLNVQIPPNVWFPFGVKVKLGSSSVAVELKGCAQTSCFAQAAMTDNSLTVMKASPEESAIQYKEVNEREISIAVSMKGFAPALEWAMKNK